MHSSEARLSDKGSLHSGRLCCLVKYVLYVDFVLLSCLDRNLYIIRAVPFTDIRSIRRHNPAFGWQYVIVVLSSGEFLLKKSWDVKGELVDLEANEIEAGREIVAQLYR